MRTISNSVALKFRGGGYSLSVLNRGKEGQEDYCQSSTGRAEKEAKKREKKLVNYKGNGWGETKRQKWK